jgi:hypothetical protein
VIRAKGVFLVWRCSNMLQPLIPSDELLHLSCARWIGTLVNIAYTMMGSCHVSSKFTFISKRVFECTSWFSTQQWMGVNVSQMMLVGYSRLECRFGRAPTPGASGLKSPQRAGSTGVGEQVRLKVLGRGKQ